MPIDELYIVIEIILRSCFKIFIDKKEVYSGDASGDENLITDDDDLKNDLKLGNEFQI